MMIEVFKTNVTDPGHAVLLLDRIHRTFIDCEANFDLEDCDNILRVKCRKELVQSSLMIRFMESWGFKAEVLL